MEKESGWLFVCRRSWHEKRGDYYDKESGLGNTNSICPDICVIIFKSDIYLIYLFHIYIYIYIYIYSLNS